uniref:Uncharacterized protein n=1 Tax=Romanomermis culicivorax TaxID=13658 RepID=A0A915K5V3_ROMCU
MVPNGFRSVKVLMRTMHPKLLTTLKVPKKKKKKQKDEWMETGFDAQHLACHWPCFWLRLVLPLNTPMLRIYCFAMLKILI